ncbi:polysaccharide deacetylase family protein [Salinispira pacifica]
MKQYLSLALILGISCAAFGEVTFSGLDLAGPEAGSNQLLFTAGVDVPEYGSYSALFDAEVGSGKLRQLTYFPEQVMLLSSSGKLQIQNRFGVFRSRSDISASSSPAFDAVGDFPAFVNGSSIQTGKISPLDSSPDGRFLLYLEPTSPAYAKLIIDDVQQGRRTVIADKVEFSLQGPPVVWSPKSDYFIYSKNRRLYYYSIAQLTGDRVLSEELRSIGDGSIADVRWGDNGDIYYVTGSLVYRISSAEFFTRSLYHSFLKIGRIAGKIPFQFDPNFDRFWVNPDGDKILLDKGGRNLFLYILQTDDYLTTGDSVSLPYLFLPRNSSVRQVAWTQDDRITVLTRSIENGQFRSDIYRLDLSSAASSYAFSRTNDTGVTSISLEPRSGEQIALLTDAGIVLKNYATWTTTRILSHPEPLHALWTDRGDLVVTGRFYSELIDLSSPASVGSARGGRSRFLAFSQAQDYGFAQTSSGVSGTLVDVRTRGFTRRYDSTAGEWQNVTDFKVAPPNQANDSYRVYLEPQTSGSYRNTVMVRNIQGVGTTPLFNPPERSYEPFPSKDEPVDLTNFSHGSRIRRREVALAFNAISSVEGLTQVLNILKEYNVRATFFVNGDFIRQHPGAVKEIADSGQEVGSLFFTYFNMADSRFQITGDFIKQGLARNEDDYFQATGKELSLLWHAPYYFTSPGIITASREMNYSYAGRDVDSLDWVPKHDDNGLSTLYHPASDLVERVVSEKKPGSIISLTIGTPQDNFAAAGITVGARDDYLFQKLDVLLNALIERGYTAVTVSTLKDHAK